MIAHIMFCISFVVVVVRSRLIGFDRSLEEAAQDLGASPFKTFWRVTFPLILPGVIAGALLAFALSIDDFVVSNFNSGTTVTFPLYIFGAAQRGIPVEVNAVATILFAATLIAMGFTVLQQRRAERMLACARRRKAHRAVVAVGWPAGANEERGRWRVQRRRLTHGSRAPAERASRPNAIGYLTNLVISRRLGGAGLQPRRHAGLHRRDRRHGACTPPP